MKKINYLEGVRGLAAFLVFVHHFLLSFYPSHYYGDVNSLHTLSAELMYFRSPFGFLFNGNFMVCIFFILSGYVLSRKYFIDENFDYLISASGKRFLRLSIPVIAAIVLSYILIKCSLYYNSDASIYAKSAFLRKIMEVHPTFIGFIQEVVYKTMFWGNNDFDTTVWSISIELYGSFLVFGLLLFTHRLKNKSLIFALVLLVLFSSFSKYYIAFVLGILINYLPQIQEKISKKYLLIISLLMLLGGCFLGGFPSTGVVENTFFSFVKSNSIAKNFILIHIAGAFLLIVAIQISKPLQAIFGAKLFTFLGKISFGLYLLHPLVIGSFSSFLFLKLNAQAISYNYNVLIVFMSSLIFCFFISNYFAKYIDAFSVRYSKTVFEKYFKRSK